MGIGEESYRKLNKDKTSTKSRNGRSAWSFRYSRLPQQVDLNVPQEHLKGSFPPSFQQVSRDYLHSSAEMHSIMAMLHIVLPYHAIRGEPCEN